MMKVRRGDVPASVPEVTFHEGHHPLNSSVMQGGFEQNNEGMPSTNLRDHNGCHADKAAIEATTHYDGDYGVSLPASNVKKN